MNKVVKYGLIGFVGLGVVGAILDAAKSPEQRAAEAAAAQEEQANAAEAEQQRVQQEAASLPEVTASELARAYDENTVAADQRFKGKKFKVSGVVDEIGTDIMNDPYVDLRGGVNEYMEPRFSFSSSASDQLATLRKGTRVTLVCTGNGDMVKMALSKDCTLVQ